jgi:hypothetical protein
VLIRDTGRPSLYAKPGDAADPKDSFQRSSAGAGSLKCPEIYKNLALTAADTSANRGR